MADAGEDADADDRLDFLEDRSGSDPRRRFLELVCARRAALTVGFVLSGLMFVTAVALVLFADIPRGSSVIAVADAVITGVLVVATFGTLRACNRLRRGE
ncbi:MAG: hypothetical protein ABEJ89_09370 [Haloarculaceae archaeon]